MKLLQAISLGLLVVATVVIAGCGDKNSDKLVGKWSLDTDATLKQMEASAKTDEEKAAMGMAKGLIGMMKLEFEFTSDGKMKITMPGMDAGKTEEGTYKVKTEDPLVISGTIDGETKDLPIKFIDSDTIEFSMPEEEGPGAMVLKRVK